MQQQIQMLTPKQNSQVSALMMHCEAFDHASTCIQMDHSLNANQEMDSWFLTYDGADLIGVASVFAPSREEAEIAICVAPPHRGRGVGMRLLDGTCRYLKTLDVETLLLVCDNASNSGRRFAEQHHQSLHHTEYDLRLAGPFHGVPASRLVVREAAQTDFQDIKAVCQSAYGEGDRDFDSFLTHSMGLENRRGYVGLLDEKPVATCFMGLEEEAFSLNTVAVHADHQGKGLGREFLSDLLHRMEGKARYAEISVDSTNQSACFLYRKLGFEEVRAISYHVVALTDSTTGS